MNQDVQGSYTSYVRELMDRKGQLCPEDLVTDAKKKTSPLHSYFEWNDQVAGHAYRLQQAQLLLVSAQLRAREKQRLGLSSEASVRAFINVGQSQYIPTPVAVQDPNIMALELQRFHTALQSLVERYRDFMSLGPYAGLFAELDPVLAHIEHEIAASKTPVQLEAARPVPPTQPPRRTRRSVVSP